MGSFNASASAAIIAAVLFSLGAVLISIARGIENGDGGIGLMKWEVPERKVISVNVTAPAPELMATSFVPYFSYTGDLVVAGTVGPVKTIGTTQSFTFHLSGIDPACSSGHHGPASNSCGMHIHAAKTCAADAGGHFFLSVTSDPWASISYRADVHDGSTGPVTSGVRTVNTGALASDLEGRAMIVHDHAGGRIGCALLTYADETDDLAETVAATNADGTITTEKTLDPVTSFWEGYTDRMQDKWRNRRAAQAPLVFGLFCSLLGWALALPAVSSLAHVLGGPSNSATTVVLYPFLAAAVLAMVEFTSEAGTAMTADWMSQWALLSRTPVRNEMEAELSPMQAFEISYMLSQSRSLWLYAMDNLLLATTLGASAAIVCCERAHGLSKAHAALGCLGAVLCIAEFGFEVTRFINWRVSVNAGILTTLAIDALVLPLWLVWLACQLCSITSQGGHYTSTSHAIDPMKQSAQQQAADLESAYDASMKDEGKDAQGDAAGVGIELNDMSK